MNKITTYIGAYQRPLTLLLMFIIINPHALDAFLGVTAQQYVMKGTAVIIAFIGFLKDYKMADAKTVTDLITAIPIPANPIPSTSIAPIVMMKAEVTK